MRVSTHGHIHFTHIDYSNVLLTRCHCYGYKYSIPCQIDRRILQLRDNLAAATIKCFARQLQSAIMAAINYGVCKLEENWMQDRVRS